MKTWTVETDMRRMKFTCSCSNVMYCLYGWYGDDEASINYVKGWVKGLEMIHDGHKYVITEYPGSLKEDRVR